MSFHTIFTGSKEISTVRYHSPKTYSLSRKAFLEFTSLPLASDETIPKPTSFPLKTEAKLIFKVV